MPKRKSNKKRPTKRLEFMTGKAGQKGKELKEKGGPSARYVQELGTRRATADRVYLKNRGSGKSAKESAPGDKLGQSQSGGHAKSIRHGSKRKKKKTSPSRKEAERGYVQGT